MTDKLFSVETGTSAQTIAKIFDILLPDARTVLDMTYGHGGFWTKTTKPSGLTVTGNDLNPDRGRDSVGDFYALDYPDNSFDVTVFDPPWHTNSGRGKPSVMAARFGSFETMEDLIEAVTMGIMEAKRVARLAVIVKCQDHIHGNRLVMMSDMVREAMAPHLLYDKIEGALFDGDGAPKKLTSPSWKHGQLSVWRNHSTYLVFRLDSPMHKRRKHRPRRVMPVALGAPCPHCRAPRSVVPAKNKHGHVCTECGATVKLSPYLANVASNAPRLPGS